MNRIFWLALLFSALLTGAAVNGELPSLSWAASSGDPAPLPTIDAGCEMDPNGRPCLPGS